MAGIVEKWGGAIAVRGFAQIPNDLMYINSLLEEGNKLSATELLILLQLATGWWHRDSFPFPAMATLAKRCGVSERQVQRTVAKLEKGGFLTRIPRRRARSKASNGYDLNPLAAMLTRLVRQSPTDFPRKVQGAATQHVGRRGD